MSDHGDDKSDDKIFTGIFRAQDQTVGEYAAVFGSIAQNLPALAHHLGPLALLHCLRQISMVVNLAAENGSHSVTIESVARGGKGYLFVSTSSFEDIAAMRSKSDDGKVATDLAKSCDAVRARMSVDDQAAN
jgi:hypothetical protein